MTFKPFSTLPRLARLALLSAALLAGLQASARADDVFTVSDVKVDVKAENAVAAREKAFDQAQTIAFTALARRLLGDDAAKTYKVPDVQTISTMIKDFEITNERISSVEYIGTYTFRFEGAAIRNRFNVQGLKYNDVPSKPVLILPFFQAGKITTLWQEPNPWMNAWSRYDGKGGLVPVTLPLGDAPDIADIGGDQALTYKADNLAALVARYGTGEAVILIATPGPQDAGGVPADLSIAIYRTDEGAPQLVQTLKIVPDSGSTADALYDKAVRAIRTALQQSWKTKTVVDPAQGGSTITVHVQFTTMQEWVTIRQALQGLPGLGDMKVRSVTPREADVDLGFSGGIERLKAVLAQSDLVLSAPPENAMEMGYSLALRKAPDY